MYRIRSFLISALLCLLLFCCSVQATNLQITVLDSLDNVTIPHATVFVNGAEYALTNNNGQALYVHDGTSDLLVRVSMLGYDDWTNTVGRNETVLLVNLSRKALILTVRLYDSDNLGPVAGALVNISAFNSTEGHQSGAAGTATFGVNASALYSITITSPDYQPISGTVSIGTEDKTVEYYLLSKNRFSFVVKSKESQVPVSGAEIYLNSILAGKTDERGILSIPVTRGKEYTIDIKKDGYVTFTEKRTISDSDALYTADISKATLGAFVYVYDENQNPLSGAEVYLNGSLSGTTNQYGRFTLSDLVLGSYPVEIRKTGFVPSNRTIVVVNKTDDYTFTLAFESASLTVYVQDTDLKVIPNATIAFDGTVKGHTDSHGQFVTSVKFNQTYNITASQEGYQPASVQERVVQGNATQSVNITLEKAADWGLVGIIVIILIVVLVLLLAVRVFRRKPGHHIVRRNEI